MRRKVIAGNWKMNMLPNEAMEMISKLAPLVKETENEVVICAPYIDLFYSLLAAQDTNIKIGAQNMHFEEKGAYTGEVSGKMLKSIGVEYVIIGHSERRQYFAETDETVNKKVKAAFLNGLKPIVCVGETLEQREAGKTVEIITKQTELALEGLTDEQVKKSEEYMDATPISIEPLDTKEKVVIDVTLEGENNKSRVIIKTKHDNFVFLQQNNLVLLDEVDGFAEMAEVQTTEKKENIIIIL